MGNDVTGSNLNFSCSHSSLPHTYLILLNSEKITFANETAFTTHSKHHY